MRRMGRKDGEEVGKMGYKIGIESGNCVEELEKNKS